MHRYTIVVGGTDFTVDVQELGADEFQVHVEGRELDVKLSGDEELAEGAITPAIVVSDEGAAAGPVRTAAAAPRIAGRGSSAPALHAPMPGVIATITARPGVAVSRGEVLLTLEAMKMRNDIRAPRDAVVDEIFVVEGQNIGFGDLLLRFRDSK